MSNTNPPAKPFLPGNKLGHGRPATPEDLKEAKKLNRPEIERVFNKYLHLPLNELTVLMVDKTLPVIEALVIRILHKALTEGDQLRLNFFIERLCGKVKENVHVEQTVNLVSINGNDAAKALTEDPFNKPIEVEYKELNGQ